MPFLKKAHARDWLVLMLVVLSPLLTSIAFSRMPQETRMPIHWNAAGEIDGWISGDSFLHLNVWFSIAVVLLGVIYGFLRRWLENRELAVSIARNCLALFVYFCVGLQFVLCCALFMDHWVQFRLIGVFSGGFFLIIGVTLPTLPPNRWAGFRFKWTLEDPEIWDRVHRFAEKLWICGGVLVMLGAFLLPKSWTLPVLQGVLVPLCIVPFVHAWLLARRKHSAQ